MINFNILFNTSKDGERSSTFHYYCNSIFPTVNVIIDISCGKFSGFATQNWCQSGLVETILEHNIFLFSTYQIKKNLS